MTDYKTLKGGLVKVVSSDPSNLYKGQVWYNSTSEALKIYTLGSGTWTSVEDTNTSGAGRASFGFVQSAVVAAASYPPGTNSEEYDGTDWVEGNNLNQSRDSSE